MLHHCAALFGWTCRVETNGKMMMMMMMIVFSHFSVISGQPQVFCVLSMIESMGVRTTEPGELQR